MKLRITTVELTKEKGTWLAMVDTLPIDLTNKAFPIRYGKSPEEAHDKLKKGLEREGHQIINPTNKRKQTAIKT